LHLPRACYLAFNAPSDFYQLEGNTTMTIPDWDLFALLIPVGALAGFVAGLFGIGGGIVTVVVLVVLLPELQVPADRVMHVALATSLAAIVMTSVSSTLSHHRHGAVRWPLVLRVAPAAAFGAILGGAVAHFVPDRVLRVGFGLFLLMVALRMGRGATPPSHRRLPGGSVLFGVATLIGALSSWTGIGGGSLTGPYLMAHNVPPREAVASSAAVGFPIAVAGTVGYVIGGWSRMDLPALSVGYVYLPVALVLGLSAMVFAPLGARVTHRLPARQLRLVYALFLALAALRVMFGR
jgi:uncharacterized membrane protein YfcA